jgi:hypothetical protein
MGKQNWVQKQWDSVPKSWKVELVSIVQTFIPAFIGALAISIELTGGVVWTKDALLAILLAAARSGFKAVWLLIVKQFAK